MENSKKMVIKAAEFVTDDMVVGLGTGSTIIILSKRLAVGSKKKDCRLSQ